MPATTAMPPARNKMLFAGIAVIALGGLVIALWPKDNALNPNKEKDEATGFVENTQCVQCHEPEFKEWLSSHHEKSMQIANEKTVLGDFQNTSFTHNGVTSRFFRKNGQFLVNTVGANGQKQDFLIKYTFGCEPLQQYLIELSNGQIQCLAIAWDVRGKKWFQLNPELTPKPGDARHWTGAYQRWNSMCAECHSTNFNKNFDPKTNSYKSSFSEVNVSCQACHGPGTKHVQWASQATNKRREDESKGLITSLKSSQSAEIQSCARCHSRRNQVSPEDAHGRPFHDDFMPDTLRSGLFHSDGQIQDEVYEYGSFLQSKMHAAGLRCSDCHNSHSGRLKRPGNQLCTHCHQSDKNPRYPNLPSKDYNSKAHHFHTVGKAGANCVDCHMPSQDYMSVDPRHDHSFPIPRPDLTLRIGVPNACNQCHKDRSAEWSADFMAKWYGSKVFRRPSFAIAIQGGREGHPLALASLVKRARDPKLANIVRATALELLGQYGPAALDFIAESLKDPDPMIRVSALRGLSQLDLESRVKIAPPLLNDPVRAVRLEAIPVLSVIPRERFSDADKAAFDTVLKEYETLQRAHGDLPAGPFNLAVVYSQLGRKEDAIAEYHRALKLDRRFLPAVFKLVQIFNELGRGSEAEKLLNTSLTASPKEGELHYSLGLLLGEQERWTDARAALATANRLLPDRPRILYNYGLVLQKCKSLDEAEVPIRRAHRMIPKDPEVLQALVVLMIQMDRWGEAKRLAERLVKTHPQHEPFKELLEQIKKDMK
ncbi:MAG: tetratricopeptide repeat protein [Planctomycetota bacterium]|nr:tetratricopeptide repeat protein [Planctomycetota bacterium]